MSDHQTPRIDGTQLSQFQNRTVRIIGRVENISGEHVSLYTPSTNSNNVKIELLVGPDLSEKVQNGSWAEIIGRVMEDLKVRAIDVQNFGDNINETAVAGLVKYANKSKEIFHD